MSNLQVPVLILFSLQFSTTALCQSTVTDIDGNEYGTVVIGAQEWTTENLRTTRPKDGAAIPLVTDNVQWPLLTSPGHCWYNNDQAANGDTYGALYNWYAVNTGKLCPTGWHVPTDAEWAELLDFFGGVTVAGNILKEEGTDHWAIPNMGATNASGFTALPGGQRGAYGVFDLLGLGGTWWTSTAIEGYNPGSYAMFYHSGYVGYANDGKDGGKSIRCLKGEVLGTDDLGNAPFGVRVYPNPSQQQVMVTCDQQEELMLRVADMQGKVVLEQRIVGTVAIDMQTRGMYLFTLSNDAGKVTQRIVIE